MSLYDAAQDIVYMEMVIQETLRMYPIGVLWADCVVLLWCVYTHTVPEHCALWYSHSIRYGSLLLFQVWPCLHWRLCCGWPPCQEGSPSADWNFYDPPQSWAVEWARQVWSRTVCSADALDCASSLHEHCCCRFTVYCQCHLRCH